VTPVDTSVWIGHFRRGNAGLKQLLEEAEAVTHPMILGELAGGSLPNRKRILRLLFARPRLAPASGAAVLHAIESRKWWSQGMGWVDAHLLPSARLAKTRRWTLDRRLQGVASASGGAYSQ
jgi:hypothetical protein